MKEQIKETDNNVTINKDISAETVKRYRQRVRIKEGNTVITKQKE